MSARPALALGNSAHAVPVIAHHKHARRCEFIVDAPAKMLRRNAHLSKNARRLYLGMRALADGKTGELRNGDHWYDAKEIDYAAEMCRDIRMPCMRELVAAGLASFERERIVRKVRGRRREILGRTRYTVHRPPTELSRESFAPTRAKPRVLLQSISSTVEEIDSQVFPEAPIPVGSGFSDSPFQGKSDGEETSSSSSPPSAKRDDDSLPPPDGEDLEANIQRHIEKAKNLLLRKGWPADVADATVHLIEERSDRSGTIPTSAQYFIASAQAAMADSRDRAEITKRAERRRRVMPSDELRLVASDIERESKKSGRPLRDIVEARSQRAEAVPAGTPQ